MVDGVRGIRVLDGEEANKYLEIINIFHNVAQKYDCAFIKIPTIDKRSYEVSTQSSKKIVPNQNLLNLTNKSIIETFKKIKNDKNPFANKKITLSIYKDFLKKNKI